nr:helix-turn-helix domain-containing protein [Rhizobium mesoamericanum]
MASHEAVGSAGLSKKFSHNDAGFKLSLLRRMWEDGLSYRQTAAVFSIWERRYEIGGIDALAPLRRGGPIDA